jgi:hypothetical protein
MRSSGPCQYLAVTTHLSNVCQADVDYTSGSAGNPKEAVSSHRGLVELWNDPGCCFCDLLSMLDEVTSLCTGGTTLAEDDPYMDSSVWLHRACYDSQVSLLAGPSAS